jgi:AmmeMemoRadiSam system protein A
MTFQLNIEQGTLLVKLARKAVETYLKNGTIMDVPKEIPRSLMENYGVFVTLNSTVSGEKELRGCIGFPYPTEPLAKAVIEAAVSSATQDPRFSPVSLKELESIVFELSILTSPQPVKAEKATDYPSKIKIKRDGLIV